MRHLVLPILFLALPMGAQSSQPTAAQVKKLTAERNELKSRLAASEGLQEELVAAQKGRDQAKAETAQIRQELDSLKASLKENQNGFDPILKELKTTRKQLEESKAETERLTRENGLLRDRLGPPKEGELVILGEDIIPAKPLNLHRVSPVIKSGWGKPKGIVLVNVLVDSKGEVTAARLLQGLSGDERDTRPIQESCVDAAKKVVFEPATSLDGKTKFQVWQAVGFYLN